MNAQRYYDNWQAHIGGFDDRDRYYTEVWENVLLPLRKMAEKGESGFVSCPGSRDSNVGAYFWGLVVGENHYISLSCFVGSFSKGRLGVRPDAGSEPPGLEVYER